MPNLLKLFISYASEDQRLVDVIVEALKNSFRHAISMTYMSQFEPGIDYRQEIDQKLDAADVLLVVASGKLKLSHSFTGYEAGYFRHSQQATPNISGTTLPRIILPIAVLTEPPGTVSEIQGVHLPEQNRLFMHFDPKGDAISGSDQMIYKLLIRLDQIIQDINDQKRSLVDSSELQTQLKFASKMFSCKFDEALRTIPISQQLPKIKFSVTLPSSWGQHKQALHNIMTVAVHGPTNNLFSSQPTQNPGPWLGFQALLGENDLALSWTDAIESLVIASIEGEDFANEDQLVLSYDEKQVYRLFVSKCTVYFDKSREIDIYIIPIFHTADAGDPLTTYLAKAISVSLRYRSLFLEAASPYAPINFKFLNDSGLHRSIRGMLKELRVLLVRGREAGLSAPQNLATLFGRDDAAVSTVAEMTGKWEEIKSYVYTSAGKVLNTSAQSTVFVSKLETFCEELDKMNRFYLKLAIARLNKVIM